MNICSRKKELQGNFSKKLGNTCIMAAAIAYLPNSEKGFQYINWASCFRTSHTNCHSITVSQVWHEDCPVFCTCWRKKLSPYSMHFPTNMVSFSANQNVTYQVDSWFDSNMLAWILKTFSSIMTLISKHQNVTYQLDSWFDYDILTYWNCCFKRNTNLHFILFCKRKEKTN